MRIDGENYQVGKIISWITSLDHSAKEVIYVPTEANIPIMEAGKR